MRTSHLIELFVYVRVTSTLVCRLVPTVSVETSMIIMEKNLMDVPAFVLVIPSRDVEVDMLTQCMQQVRSVP